MDCCLVPSALLIRRACARNSGSHLFHVVMEQVTKVASLLEAECLLDISNI